MTDLSPGRASALRPRERISKLTCARADGAVVERTVRKEADGERVFEVCPNRRGEGCSRAAAAVAY